MTNNVQAEGSFLLRAGTWLVSLLVPVVLTLSMVRLLLGPWFLELEYSMPGFPADTYGFTQEERLHWARFAVDYLVNDSGIDYLSNLRFPEGQQAPPESCAEMKDCNRLYNERELSHMLDVKIVVQRTLTVWGYSLAALFALAVIYLSKFQGGLFWRALGRGGWWTAGLCLIVVALILVAFGTVFVVFHDLFFTSGTWTFYYSDTLIRLFPEQFWRDIFLLGLGIPALAGALLGWHLAPRH